MKSPLLSSEPFWWGKEGNGLTVELTSSPSLPSCVSSGSSLPLSQPQCPICTRGAGTDASAATPTPPVEVLYSEASFPHCAAMAAQVASFPTSSRLSSHSPALLPPSFVKNFPSAFPYMIVIYLHAWGPSRTGTILHLSVLCPSIPGKDMANAQKNIVILTLSPDSRTGSVSN